MNILPIITSKSIGMLQKLCDQYYIPFVLTAGPIDMPLQTFAHENSINILQVNQSEWFNNGVLNSLIKTLNIELIIVSGLPWKMPINLINTPKYGTINIHPSLLPSLRGAWPLPYYILNDEKYFGYTLHIMDDTYDTGPILYQEKFPMNNYITCEELESKIEYSINKKIVEVIDLYIKGNIAPRSQDHGNATYASTRELFEQNTLNSSMDLNLVSRIFRAFNKNIGVYYQHENFLYKVLSFRIAEPEASYVGAVVSTNKILLNLQLRDATLELLCDSQGFNRQN